MQNRSLMLMLFLGCALLLSACGSKDLSRPEAAKLITEMLKKEEPPTTHHLIDSIKKTPNGRYAIEIMDMFQDSEGKWFNDLAKAQLLTYKLITKRKGQGPGYDVSVYDVEWTSKGQPYILQKGGKTHYVLSVVEGVEVTGIAKESETTALVTFVATLAPSPFVTAFNFQTEYVGKKNAALTFRRFDDGWRLQIGAGSLESSQAIPTTQPLPPAKNMTRTPVIPAVGDKATERIGAGESRDNWSLTKTGELTFEQQPVAKAGDPPAAELRISKGSGNGALRYAILADRDKGPMEGFIWGKGGKGVLARLPGPGISDTVYWSPDGAYAIVTDAGEVQDEVHVVNLNNGQVTKRKVGASVTDCEMKVLYGQPTSWLGNSSFQVTVGIEKNPYESKCSNVKPRSITADVSLN